MVGRWTVGRLVVEEDPELDRPLPRPRPRPLPTDGERLDVVPGPGGPPTAATPTTGKYPRAPRKSLSKRCAS